jgi:hypothetical protein
MVVGVVVVVLVVLDEADVGGDMAGVVALE